MGVQARPASLTLIFDKVGMDMNRVILLNNLLALATIAVLGPGTSILVREAARQAFALVRRKPARR